MYQTPASKQRKKKTKRLRKLQQKQKIKIKTLCPSRSVYVISFSVYVCAFIYSNFFLLFCNKKKKTGEMDGCCKFKMVTSLFFVSSSSSYSSLHKMTRIISSLFCAFIFFFEYNENHYV